MTTSIPALPAEHAESQPVIAAIRRPAKRRERLMWGSDWPHPTEKAKPDDAILFDLLGEWAPHAATRARILVADPAQLYGFA